MAFFEAVVAQLGHAFRQHVTAGFDGFAHLVNEFTLSSDGHRPMSEDFRSACDDMLLDALKATGVPYVILGGTAQERLRAIAEHFRLPVVTGVDEAVERAAADYAAIDWRLETERAAAAGASA